MIPANQDIATIDIIERAAAVDPQGERTLGVLTKPDLIGPGSEEEVLQVLLNARKPLRLGSVMVKNASQRELNERPQASREDARDMEMKFFQSH